MKTSLIASKAVGVSLGLLFSAFLAGNAIAGPGPQYWQSVGKAAAPAAQSAKVADLAVSICLGSEVVPVTAMKPSLPNGRGPLAPVQVGTERVCHVCTTSTVVTTNDWPNHRGPLVQKIEVTKVGATHVCTTACTPSPKA